MKKYILMLAFLIGILIIFNSRFLDISEIENSLSQRRTRGLNQQNWKETYMSDVEIDQKSRLSLNSENVEKAELFWYNFQVKTFNKEQTIKLVQIINDSASYVWGEIGTPQYNRAIVFYDRNNDIVGITRIESDRKQTTTEPMTRTMKWGYLSKVGSEKFNQIVFE